MRQDELTEIRALPLFRNMEAENFDRLFRGAYVQTFPQGVELAREGEMADFFHVVLDGSVELFANWNGRKSTLATIHPLSTFILAATIKNGPYLMSAQTLEKSRMILLPSTDVRAHFAADSGFARAIVLELAQCYRVVVKSHKDIKLRTSPERLANYLLRQSATAADPSSFDLKMEKKRLASFLGMTPENLSRSIKALNTHGVEIALNNVRIVDFNLLRDYAKPDDLIDNPTI